MFSGAAAGCVVILGICPSLCTTGAHKSMNSKKIMITVLLLILVFSMCVGGVSARYTVSGVDNKGINPGDYIYLGEQNLDFSAFKNSSSSELPRYMIRIVDGEVGGQIPLSKGIGTPMNIPGGRYYPEYSDGTRDTSRWAYVTTLTLGEIRIYTYATSFTPTDLPARPDAIPKTMNVSFYVPNLDVSGANLTGNWYEYILRGNIETSRIINMAGTSIDLTALTIDPRQPDQNLAFQLIKQNVIPSTGDTPASMTFRTKLNGLSISTTYEFTATVNPTSLTLSETSVDQGGSLVVTLKGVPFTGYPLTITPADKDNPPFFSGGTWEQQRTNQDITVHPEWSGQRQIQINIPDNCPTGSYRVQTVDPDTGQTISRTFTVTATGMTLTFEEPPTDATSGRFAVGDRISLKGSVIGATDSVRVYLNITGSTLPANGAKLDDPGSEVIDGDPTSFTVVTYSPNMGSWNYEWWTKGFEPGTYTIHATLAVDEHGPYGSLASDYPGGLGNLDGKVPPSLDYSLSEQSIQAKSSEKTGGYFAKGDVLYFSWLARGSPGVTDAHPNGEVRWYIFGTNFRYADRNDMIPVTSGSSSSWAEYGFSYDRSFTYSLSPGTYYLIFQHPGPNNIFDIYADGSARDGGTLATISTTYGSSSDFSYLQGSAAANALTKMFEDPKSDDLYVMTQFVIEEPWITIDSVGQIAVGDSFTISGKTNLAAPDTTSDNTKTEDTLWLTINRLDFNVVGDTSTAMKIPVDTTTPSSPIPFRGYRTFAYGSIDTSTWYPGTYEVTITCKDLNLKQSYSFELLTPDAKASATTAVPTRDPALSDDPYATTPATPLKTPTPTSAAWTPVPTLTTAPGFGVGIAILGLVLGTIAIRVRRR